jgi:hypothetical protein
VSLPLQGRKLNYKCGFSIARSFGTNSTTASTIYPIVMCAFQGFDSETILRTAINRAGWGSVKSALATIGIQIAASILLSAHKILKFH